jgi:hypothetical protein
MCQDHNKATGGAATQIAALCCGQGSCCRFATMPWLLKWPFLCLLSSAAPVGLCRRPLARPGGHVCRAAGCGRPQGCRPLLSPVQRVLRSAFLACLFLLAGLASSSDALQGSGELQLMIALLSRRLAGVHAAQCHRDAARPAGLVRVTLAKQSTWSPNPSSYFDCAATRPQMSSDIRRSARLALTSPG